jgi:DNA invertase Pin-like site-specific DNA recombinase
MRVIVAGRLSKKEGRNNAVGFDSQESESISWAESNGHDIVAVVADYKTGRSGLHSRPHLREWVTDPARLAQYDAIVALKLDRLTRGDRAETRQLEQWADDNGKRLLVVSPEVSYPAEGHNGITWDVLMRLSHAEWLSIAERYQRGQRTAALNGGWVGSVPWGYVITGPKYGKTVAPDETLRPVLRGMVERYLEGKSLAQIASWLDTEGIPPATNCPADCAREHEHIDSLWSSKSVSQVLDNPILSGVHEYTATDQDGNPKRYRVKVAPVLSMREWNAVQTKRRTTRRRGPVVNGAALLVGIARCGVKKRDDNGDEHTCNGPMYRHASNYRRKDGSVLVQYYYRCTGAPPKQRSTCRNMVPLAELDKAVDRYMSTELAKALEMVEQQVTPGANHADDIDRIDADIRALDPADADWLDQAQALKARRDELAALPVTPDAVVLAFTGESLAHRWASLPDTAARRSFLLAAGASVSVHPGEAADVQVTFPDALRLRDGGVRVAVALGRPDQ